MNYQETLDFLFGQLPAFERTGKSDYKPGLETTLTLCEAFGNPQNRFKSIHIAGTNGKGSTAHSMAAVLTASGIKTGLFTSPHLVDFRERMRIDGQMIEEEEVVDFVERYLAMNLGIKPSFFELTTVMAFDFFARHDVETAVIETGLGGRLDSTNVITPILSVITNIAFDHTDMLGNTLEAIAFEKAGIIKKNVPVVVSEKVNDNVANVFSQKASQTESELIFAEEIDLFSDYQQTENEYATYFNTPYGTITSDLTGPWQPRNMRGILASIPLIDDKRITPETIRHGLSNVKKLTSLTGRWTIISHDPLTVVDTGHNPAGWEMISARLKDFRGKKHIVAGFVADKNVEEIARMLSKIDNVIVYPTSPSSHRALSAELLTKFLHDNNVATGCQPSTPDEAYKNARSAASPDDMILVAGSNYLIGQMIAEGIISMR